MKQVDLNTRDWMESPASKRDYNRALFTEVSARYDFVTRALSLGRDRHWKSALIDALPDRGDCNCLDLACGSGDVTRALARRFPQGQTVGLDICEPMLRLARHEVHDENLYLIQGDMGNLPCTTASMDVVTGSYALRNAPDLDGVLAETRRVLRPGGVAAFLDFSNPPQRALQSLEHGVLMTWGGFWGLALHRNPEVYAYIARSLRRFPDRVELRDRFRDHGFRVTQSRRFFLGVLELVVLQLDKDPR